MHTPVFIARRATGSGGGGPAGGYLAEFDALNAAGRTSHWAVGDDGAALKVGDRITLGSEYLENPTSTHSLQKAKTERSNFLRDVISQANSRGHVAVVESSTVGTVGSTMPAFHFDRLKLVCARSAKPHTGVAKRPRTTHTDGVASLEGAVPAAAMTAAVPAPLALPSSNVQPLCLGVLTHAGQQALVTLRDDHSSLFTGLSRGRLYAGCGTAGIRSIAVAVAAMVPELFPLELSKLFLDNIRFLKALSESNGIKVTRSTEEALIAGLSLRSFTTAAVIPRPPTCRRCCQLSLIMP